jgi:hypothetical protein
MQQALYQQHDNTQQTVGNLPNFCSTVQETPGPHRLQPKAERPEDIAYKQKQAEQQDEEARTNHTPDPASPEQAILNIFTSLQQVIANNNKHLHAFNGVDYSNWDDWYLQLRTYLEAKGWLTTFAHPTGPGTAGFDLEINKKMYITNYLHYAEKVQPQHTLPKRPISMAGKLPGFYSTAMRAVKSRHFTLTRYKQDKTQ